MRDHRARDGAPRGDLQTRKFVVRDHEVPNLVVLPSENPIITVPDDTRLDKPALPRNLGPPAQEDADTIQARRQAVMDPDFLNLGAVPGDDADGTPVGEDGFNRHMGSRADAEPEPPDDPRPPQEAVVSQRDPGGVIVDVAADDSKAAQVDHGVGGEGQTGTGASA